MAKHPPRLLSGGNPQRTTCLGLSRGRQRRAAVAAWLVRMSAYAELHCLSNFSLRRLQRRGTLRPCSAPLSGPGDHRRMQPGRYRAGLAGGAGASGTTDRRQRNPPRTGAQAGPPGGGPGGLPEPLSPHHPRPATSRQGPLPAAARDRNSRSPACWRSGCRTTMRTSRLPGSANASPAPLAGRLHRGADDDARLDKLLALASHLRLPPVACGDVHMHARGRQPCRTA